MCSFLPGVRTSTSSMGHRDRETRDSPSPKRPRRPRDQSNARRSRPPPFFSLSALHRHLISSQLSSPTNYQSPTTTARGPTSLSRPRTTPPSRSTSATSTPRASSLARRRRSRSPATSAPGAPPTPRSTCCGRYGDDDCYLATLKRECDERRTLGKRSSLRGQTGDRRGELQLTFFPPFSALFQKKNSTFSRRRPRPLAPSKGMGIRRSNYLTESACVFCT